MSNLIEIGQKAKYSDIEGTEMNEVRERKISLAECLRQILCFLKYHNFFYESNYGIP